MPRSFGYGSRHPLATGRLCDRAFLLLAALVGCGADAATPGAALGVDAGADAGSSDPHASRERVGGSASRDGRVESGLRPSRFDAIAGVDVLTSESGCRATPSSEFDSLFLDAGDAAGGFREPSTIVVGAAPAFGVPADVDGDGLSDVVAVTPGTVHADASDGRGMFSPAGTTAIDSLAPTNSASGPRATSRHAGDVLLGARLFASAGDGTFTFASLPGGEGEQSVNDMNADAHPDLVLGAEGQRLVFSSDAARSLPAEPSYEIVSDSLQPTSADQPPLHCRDCFAESIHLSG